MRGVPVPVSKMRTPPALRPASETKAAAPATYRPLLISERYLSQTTMPITTNAEAKMITNVVVSRPLIPTSPQCQWRTDVGYGFKELTPPARDPRGLFAKIRPAGGLP